MGGKNAERVGAGKRGEAPFFQKKPKNIRKNLDFVALLC
jgi:hypothetical protein